MSPPAPPSSGTDGRRRFSQFPGCPEPGDPRSTYSAFAISSILDDWSAVGVDSALEFLKTCQVSLATLSSLWIRDNSYRSVQKEALLLGPASNLKVRPPAFLRNRADNPKGGTTYCAIASFSLASRISSILRAEAVLRWLVDRQTTPPEHVVDEDSDCEAEVDRPAEEVAGFQGRIGKDTDACYSFWCTASIKVRPSPPDDLAETDRNHRAQLLRPDLDILRPELDRRWLHSCQHPVFGGIAREPGAFPGTPLAPFLGPHSLLARTDVYHTYLSLAALSLGGEPGLRPLDAAWNVSTEVAERIRNMRR